MATSTSKTKVPAKAPAKSASSKTAAKTSKAAAPKTTAAKAVAAKAVTAKPAAPKTVAAKPAAKPTPAAKPKAAAKTSKAVAARVAVSPDQRRFYVEVAAYYIAERRGFHGGSELADWAQAEKEIDQLLAAGRINL